MSIAWIAPIALAGAGLIALPIAIHLLVRQHARTIAYPSLRFLRETQLAAFRRRTIQDAGLLLCRAAIIAVAAVALAGPILQTSSRSAGYAARTSRAVVVVESADGALISKLTSGAFASATFRRETIADSLADAVRWLDQQPSSSREIVIAGAFRRGAVAESDLLAIPVEIGVRFEMVPTPAATDAIWPVLTRRDGALVRIDRAARFEIDATRVADGNVTRLPDDLVSITARAEDTTLANAALRAALDAGVPWTEFDRRVLIVWEGAAPAIDPPANARTIRMTVPSPPSSAADAVLAALNDASRRIPLEPVMMTAEQLNKWSRPPGPPANNAPLADEGDRRWLWAVALLLLGLETWLRRSRTESRAADEPKGSSPQGSSSQEARVA